MIYSYTESCARTISNHKAVIKSQREGGWFSFNRGTEVAHLTSRCQQHSILLTGLMLNDHTDDSHELVSVCPQFSKDIN